MAKHKTAAELRLCVERILPADMKIIAAQRAIRINPANDPRPVIEKAFHKAGLAGATLTPAKMALVTGKKWKKTGQVLRVRFLDGSATQRARVRQFAEQWLPFMSVRFDWKGKSDAEVRISFEADG